MTKQKLLKLNLGCGRDLKEGWINLDIVPEFHPDVIHDLSDPLPFKDGSSDEVIAQDILEHFTYEDVDKLIAEIARVLVIGGKVHIRVPNVDQIITQFDENPWVRNHFLYGNTETTGVFGAHKMGFTPEVLLTKMMRWGLYPETLETIVTNFEATFVRKKVDQPEVKKVVYVNQSLSVGGAETFMTDLLSSIKSDLGYSIQVFSNNDNVISTFRKLHIPASLTPVIIDIIGNWKGLIKASVLWPFSLWQYFKAAWKSRSANVVILSGFSEKIVFSPIAQLLNIPLLWIEFAPLDTVFKKHFRLPKFLYRAVKDIPDAIIVPTHYTKQFLVPPARIDLSKCIVIPCGRSFEKEGTPKVTSKRNLSKGSHPLGEKVVCISRMEAGKGQELLVKAIPRIIKKHPSCVIEFIGEGDHLETVKQVAKKLKVEKFIQFKGYVPDVFAHLYESSVCVFPSMWPLEGFGMVMIEAMACGKPVVAFARGPALEIIDDGQTGLLAKKGDIDDLADKITTLLDNKTLAEMLGKRAQKIVREKYSIKTVAKSYGEVFTEIKNLREAKKWLHSHSFHNLN